MEIRYHTTGDSLAEISGVYEKSWKYAYQDIIPQSYLDAIPAGNWVDFIQNADGKHLIAVENGEIIGAAFCCPSRWNDYKEFGEIVSLYFLPEYIGKSCGRQMLRRCIEELEMLGFTEILLWVLEENHRARRFYEQNGFILSMERRGDRIGGKEVLEMMYIYQPE